MDTFAEILRTIFVFILIVASGFYLRHLEKTRKERALSPSERAMLISLNIAYLLFAASIVVSVFF
ncbi:MAG: hypothetical protein C0P75_011525 [Bacilli bacterium]|uniref:Uncharacterized protein n=1 Tax=Ureibacillus suwonensis TaxID=313007 RepID=A0ABW0RD60_9BACL|nr:hypothetical protein [Bacilli bacterium]